MFVWLFAIGCCVSDRVARMVRTDAVTPTPSRVYEIRTWFGRPNSSIRFKAAAAMATLLQGSAGLPARA